jgi:predicted RNA-binding protein YlxR (DUF448 family)/ribosomal protein L30E
VMPTPASTGQGAVRRDRSDRNRRTCVGCGQEDAIEAMVRIVVSDGGDVAVDLAGGAFGRGAHVHPSAACIALAPRGLAKSFKRNIAVTGAELGATLVAAADRRVYGLLASAARSGHVQIGADLAGQAFNDGKVHLLVVARDAQSGASVGSVMHAVAQGGAVAWGTKAELGTLVQKSEVAVLGVESSSLSAAIRSAAMVASCIAERGESIGEERTIGKHARRGNEGRRRVDE